MRWLALLAMTACSSAAAITTGNDAGTEPAPVAPQPLQEPSTDAGAPNAALDAADAATCPLGDASTGPVGTCTAVTRDCCTSAWSCLSDAGPTRPDADCTELGGGVTLIPATGERFWTSEHCCATLSH